MQVKSNVQFYIMYKASAEKLFMLIVLKQIIADHQAMLFAANYSVDLLFAFKRGNSAEPLANCSNYEEVTSWVVY